MQFGGLKPPQAPHKSATEYIAEKSLSITGYVTKAEKSHAQDLWEEVSSCDNIYSRLWTIGQKLLTSKEVGLYEASDLLGESLCMKSYSTLTL